MDPNTQPQIKLYRATAIARVAEAGKAPEQRTFVVRAPDYKKAWELARKLTSKGHAHFVGEAFTDNECKTPAEMTPGDFTIKEVVSLQERSKKIDPVALTALEDALKAQGIKVNKDVQAVIDSLKTKGPAAAAEPEAAAGEQAA